MQVQFIDLSKYLRAIIDIIQERVKERNIHIKIFISIIFYRKSIVENNCIKVKCVKLFIHFSFSGTIMISRRLGDEQFRTSDMSKLRMPFTFGHLVLSSRLFQTPPEALTRRPTSSAIVIQQNLKRRLVLRCIFAMHSDSVHEYARAS